MKKTVEMDASNRIVLTRELLRAAGFSHNHKLLVSATLGRIVLEAGTAPCGRIVKCGKLKIWTGAVPTTPLHEAVEQTRHYTR